MPALYQFFKSVRLAVVLLLLITVLSVAGSLVPQGWDLARYQQSYPAPLAALILALGVNRLFSSVLFLLPVALFAVNLAVCTVDRMVSRSRRQARRRFGPDLIHLGLLVLIAGALLSLQSRREGIAWLGEGDRIGLPGGYEMQLLSFRTLLYEDGRPRDWVSTVAISRGGEEVVASYPVEVNRPLKVAGLSLYQSSFRREARAVLTGSGGDRLTVVNGRGVKWGAEALLFFLGVDGPEGAAPAVFQRWEGHTVTATYRTEPAGQVGGYTLESLTFRDLTGLKVVKDPGFPVVVAALVVIAAGLTLTYVQKRKDLAV
jgi:cytochrome c biogenesis protein